VEQTIRKDRFYTYEDYLLWVNGERWEIIDGRTYNMTPVPKVKHQRVVGQFYTNLSAKIKNKGCSIFIAPTDVVFDQYNVVQPDVFIVCDKNKITEKNIQGCPDLIIEVLSPWTELKDRREKKKIYEKFGVKEYIIVHPDQEYVEQFFLEGDKFTISGIFNWDETLNLQSFDARIELSEIFEKEEEMSKI
jgi:Uma2 family endonuclease